MFTHRDLREKYITYFTGSERSHTLIQSAPLILQNDATTLFTSSGMQPLVPYLSGKERHNKGTRLVDIQPCVRTQDIDEVGDNRHTTFFEMMGNWSIGDYFKAEQLEWIWNFFVKELQLSPDRLHVTVFEGNESIPRDEESAHLWEKLGVKKDHIHFYGVKSNWWSRAGIPEKMPVGEIGGPDSEIFYDFGEGPHNGPESDEDRFLEIGNSVFIQYEKLSDGSLKELNQKNVDFGGGLERILAALAHDPDIFMTDVFEHIIASFDDTFGMSYKGHTARVRVVADHMRAAAFMIKDGISPSNKEHGYVLRRLLRRAGVQMYSVPGGLNNMPRLSQIGRSVVETYEGVYFNETDSDLIAAVIEDEMKKFGTTIEKGMHEIGKHTHISGKVAFDLFQSYGFPVEITQEEAQKKGITLDLTEFEKEKDLHKEKSRSQSTTKFKGGLADESDIVIKFHTATHLLQQALKDVFGDIIRQEGSNITQERLRFDTRLDHKLTLDECKQVQDIINQKIHDNLPVRKVTMKKSEAEKIGATAFFRDKYDDEVNIYYIGEDEKPEKAYSKEFCGGPHVLNTSEIGEIEIYKTEKIGSGTVRIYARQKGLS